VLARIALVCGALCLAACGTLPRNAVPPELMAEANIPHMPDVRGWVGRPGGALVRDLDASFDQETPAEFPQDASGTVQYAHLALSGGGPNGAFGAGLLNGWTAQGTRPVFKIVTGVSTGALMAPFAFLGPDYDGALREFYTTTATRNIVQRLSIIPALLAGESLTDSGPLAALINQHIDATLLARVADAHGKGRRLYIATVDLDAQRFVVWNMGLIAGSGRPEALELFRKVMLASASVPIVMPPVFFEVEVGPGGRRHEEMHVDGAVAASVFFSGGVFGPDVLRERGGRGRGHEDVYVIHNGQLRPVPEEVPRSLGSIAGRTLNASSRAAMVGSLFRIYAFARQGQADFYWVTIPNGVEIEGAEAFDPVRMRALYEVGYDLARKGPVWATRPPGLEPTP
jgi:predicted acylesterase/phospholipase RssA